MRPIEVMREKWRVVERKNGAVFKTQFIEYVWVPIGHPYQKGDFLYPSLSTTKSREMAARGEPTMRRKQ